MNRQLRGQGDLGAIVSCNYSSLDLYDMIIDKGVLQIKWEGALVFKIYGTFVSPLFHDRRVSNFLLATVSCLVRETQGKETIYGQR